MVFSSGGKGASTWPGAVRSHSGTPREASVNPKAAQTRLKRNQVLVCDIESLGQTTPDAFLIWAVKLSEFIHSFLMLKPQYDDAFFSQRKDSQPTEI